MIRQREEFELLKGRINIILALIVLAFGILALGFWNHQVPQSPHYRQLAERNRIRDIPMAAPRGSILDREYRVIADSRPSYNLVITRENSSRDPKETIEILASGIEASKRELLEWFEPHKGEPEYKPILLKEDLSLADIAYVKARTYELPEISLKFQPRRRYEGGELAAHLLGYVGEISQNELSRDEFSERRPGDLVGKSGLERQYDALLQGRDGIRRVIVNNYGREMGTLAEVKPVPGRDLVTTIDLDLQFAAEKAMGEQTGVAVAIQPLTGEVLALVSRPAFDPTVFARGIQLDEWEALVSDPRKLLRNRAIQNRYSPGSVFKIFMTVAGLEEQAIVTEDVQFCPGGAVFYGNTFDCWKSGGHGHISLHDALVHSCNVFFYNVGHRLGIKAISRHAIAMGLGRETGIDLPGEDAGIMPSEEWRQRISPSRWYPGETISVSIGQGPISVTPLQLTWAVGGLVTGGQLHQPHLVDPGFLRQLDFDVLDLRHERYPLQESTVEFVRRALWGVVNEVGTGTRARVRGLEVAGKTGTAQIVRKAIYDSGRRELRDHAWFVGFAPFDDPEIAVGVFVENGGNGGAVAAPMAQAVMQVYFDKKKGRLTSHPIGHSARLNE